MSDIQSSQTLYFNITYMIAIMFLQLLMCCTLYMVSDSSPKFISQSPINIPWMMIAYKNKYQEVTGDESDMPI